MKFTFPALIGLLILSACHDSGKKDKFTRGVMPTQRTVISTPTTPTEPRRVGPDFVLTENYRGDLLKMEFPNSFNWGVWSTSDNDSKALYDSLEIEATFGEGTETEMPLATKNAANILCNRTSFRNAPEVYSYSCHVVFDYLSGRVFSSVIPVLRATEPAAELKDFEGSALKIIAADEIAILTLRGSDARALYNTLTITPTVVQEDDLQYDRKANSFDCRVGHNRDLCELRLNARTGELEPLN